MRKILNNRWSIPVIFVTFIGIFAFAVYLSTPRPHPIRPNSCQSNMKQLGLAMLMYAQDYDEKFPIVTSGGDTVGWADALYPYTKSIQILQCPAEPNPSSRNPRHAGYTDYWLNANIAGTASRGLDGPKETIVMGDGDGASPASTATYAINNLPASWKQAEVSPAKRHKGSANYLFLDMHVLSVKPHQISSQSGDTYTFALPTQKEK